MKLCTSYCSNIRLYYYIVCCWELAWCTNISNSNSYSYQLFTSHCTLFLPLYAAAYLLCVLLHCTSVHLLPLHCTSVHPLKLHNCTAVYTLYHCTVQCTSSTTVLYSVHPLPLHNCTVQCTSSTTVLYSVHPLPLHNCTVQCTPLPRS